MDSIYNPEISDNSIDSHFPPSKESDLINKPYLTVTTLSTSAMSTPKFPSISNSKKSTQMPVGISNASYEFVSSSTRHPVSTSTEKYTVSMGAFNTTLGAITYRNASTTMVHVREPLVKTTTENIHLSTFHSVQNDVDKTASSTSKPITHTTTVRTTNKKSTHKPAQKSTPRPTVPSRKPIRNTISSKVTSTAKPVAHNNVTRKSTVSPTKKVIITTSKPLVTITKITTKNNLSSSSKLPTTHNFSQSSSLKQNVTKPSIVSTSPTLTTVSFVETTKAPRPKPQPTDYIVKVPPTTLSDEDFITTSFSVEIFDKTTPNPPKTTKKPITTTPISITKGITKKPESQVTSIKDVTVSTKTEQLTTISKFPIILDSSTMSSEFVTWTISDSSKENVTKGNICS